MLQGDILHDTLTVKENIKYAADLRLLRSNESEKVEIVEKIISDLGLDSCANTRIGNWLYRGNNK